MSFASLPLTDLPSAGSPPVSPEREAPHRAAAARSSLRVRISSARKCDVWVSTDLVTLSAGGSLPNTEDTIRGRKAYRVLSPDFHLWLEERFAKFEAQVKGAGKESEEARAFAARFAKIRELAHAHYTPEDFAAAHKRLAISNMESPNRATTPPASQFQYPAEGEFPCKTRVSFHALGEVDTIRDEALNLGWSDIQLYGTRGRFTFPCGPGYGLVCYVHCDQRIGKVAEKHIEIICSGGHSLHFYRKEETA